MYTNYKSSDVFPGVLRQARPSSSSKKPPMLPHTGREEPHLTDAGGKPRGGAGPDILSPCQALVFRSLSASRFSKVPQPVWAGGSDRAPSKGQEGAVL